MRSAASGHRQEFSLQRTNAEYKESKRKTGQVIRLHPPPLASCTDARLTAQSYMISIVQGFLYGKIGTHVVAVVMANSQYIG